MFYLSEQEWNRAKVLGARYEVQFWGEIDLTIEPALEYGILRSKGYPIKFTNLSEKLGTELAAVAVKLKISLADPSNSQV